METLHNAVVAAEVYSPAEEQFNRRRRTAGLVLAPLAFAVVWLWPMPGLPVLAHRQAAVMTLAIVLWMTEALPLAITAILGPVVAVVIGVAPARQALAPFADPIIFLFIGSFMIAQAMFVHKVDRRIAFSALASPAVGGSAFRIFLAYASVTMVLSMWISNTATTAMMFPIGLSIVAHLSRTSGRTSQHQVRRFAMAMMLMTAFAASIGGMATPFGTPPNLIGIGMLERLAGERVSFFEWMGIGVPIMLVLFAYLMLQFHRTSIRGLTVAEGGTALVREELTRLGPLSKAERNVLVAFAVTVLLWVTPGVIAVAGLDDTWFGRRYASAMPEGVGAMVGAFLLFLLPIDWRSRRFTLTWDDAVKIDWGIVLLFGGGLALGELTFATGLAKAVGEGVTAWLPSQSTLSLTMIFTAAGIVVSEAASNTASANMIVPIAIAVANAAGVRPLEPALGATLGASMGFMMPISTPPNAIVYSSGYIPIGQMMRHGLLLDIVSFFVIVAAVMLLV